jgi:DNA-binding NarL/FixJ family response regulator
VIRILLADDHAVVREGIRRLLEEKNGLAVVAEAATVPDLLAELRRTTIDVLVLDIGMPGPGIVETLRQIKSIQPQVRALVLTAYPEPDYAVRVLRAGAAGYLTKDRSLEQLIEAIRRVYRGGMYVSPALGEALAAQGEPLKSIAQRLAVSPKTITTYRSRIFQKLSLHSNAELVRYALEHGLLSPS